MIIRETPSILNDVTRVSTVDILKSLFRINSMTQWLEDPIVDISLNTQDNAEIAVTFIYQAVRTRDSNVLELRVVRPPRSEN
jgi:hypothetical protein